jgi:hypothetical protein
MIGGGSHARGAMMLKEWRYRCQQLCDISRDRSDTYGSRIDSGLRRWPKTGGVSQTPRPSRAVAEVEKRDDFLASRELGFDLTQRFLFGKPMVNRGFAGRTRAGRLVMHERRRE